MKAKLCLCLAICLSTVLLTQAAAPETKAPLNVRSFGATGSGTNKDTAAIQKALDACVAAGGGEVLIPAGNYLVGSIVMGSNTTLRFETNATLTGSPDREDFPLMNVRWEGEWRQGRRALIFATNATHIAITGAGSIIGPPLSLAQLRNPRGPVIIELIECKDILLDGFSVTYQRLWGIHPTYCSDIIARNLRIRTTQTNGDGIDVDSCQNLLIEHCDIDAGDDAIAIKSGRGMEAVRIGRPTQNVIIRDCTLGSSYAGVGIGTEISGGARNIRVENCAFTHGANGIFIKSRDGRGGFIENVTGENLTILGRCGAFLGIDLITKGIQAAEPVTGDVEQWTAARNISFKNIKVEGVPTLIAGRSISPARPLDSLTLSNITGTCQRGITLANVVNADFKDINVTGYNGALLSLTNVTGTGLEIKN